MWITNNRASFSPALKVYFNAISTASSGKRVHKCQSAKPFQTTQTLIPWSPNQNVQGWRYWKWRSLQKIDQSIQGKSRGKGSLANMLALVKYVTTGPNQRSENMSARSKLVQAGRHVQLRALELSLTCSGAERQQGESKNQKRPGRWWMAGKARRGYSSWRRWDQVTGCTEALQSKWPCKVW